MDVYEREVRRFIAQHQHLLPLEKRIAIAWGLQTRSQVADEIVTRVLRQRCRVAM
jgi:hypothetical protein